MEELADPEDPEEYLADNVFWVPKEARWSDLQARARQTMIGKDIDDAMLEIHAFLVPVFTTVPRASMTAGISSVMAATPSSPKSPRLSTRRLTQTDRGRTQG